MNHEKTKRAAQEIAHRRLPSQSTGRRFDFRGCGMQARIERETAKAVMVELEYDGPCGLSGKKVWFPKSQVEIAKGFVTKIKAWILNAKERELPEWAYGFCWDVEAILG